MEQPERAGLRFIGSPRIAPDGIEVMSHETNAPVTLFKEGEEIAATVTGEFGDFRLSAFAQYSGMYRTEVVHAHGVASCECELGESLYLGELRLSVAASWNEARI